MQQIMSNIYAKSALYAIVAFLLSAASSFALTTYLYTPSNSGDLAGIPTPPPGGTLNIDPSAPRDSECPVNGAMYTTAEKNVWETRRPLVTMIENSLDARPQSGLNSADVIYEAVAEGGVTRFAAVFYCGVSRADTLLAPVRSARTHFIEVASEYNRPIYQHVGGANCDGYTATTCPVDRRVRALEQISSYGWHLQNDLDARSVGLPVFKRDFARLGPDKELATEHTMTTTTESVFKYMASRGWTNKDPKGTSWSKGFTPWKFKDDAEDSKRGDVTQISYDFWVSHQDFRVTWNYDRASNSYLRSTGGQVHKDLNDDSTLTAKVVIVQLVTEYDSVDPQKHIYLDLITSGKALVFQDGDVIEATWSKKDRESRTVFKDSRGRELEFNRGKVFVSLVPKSNKITY